MNERWKHGRWPGGIGRSFVMPRVRSDGVTVYGVWVVRSRDRVGDGNGELLAEFFSKIFANKWCRARNAAAFDRRMARSAR